MITVTRCLALAAILFSVGTYGVLARRNMIVVLMSLEIMLNAVNLAIVAINRALVETGAARTELHGLQTGQVLVAMVLAVAAAEAAVGLAILVAVYRRWRTTDVGAATEMRG